MASFLHLSQILFPLLLAAISASYELHTGQYGFPLLLFSLAGALLGLVLSLTGKALAVVGGLVDIPPLERQHLSDIELEEEQEKLMALLKKIESGMTTAPLAPEEADKVLQPLHQRIMSIREKLEQLSVMPPVGGIQNSSLTKQSKVDDRNEEVRGA